MKRANKEKVSNERNAGTEKKDTDPCQDPLTPYSTTYKHVYFSKHLATPDDGGKPEAKDCPLPTAADEIKAMNAAKSYFKKLAAGYCAEGKCPKSKKCKATISGLKVSKSGTGVRVILENKYDSKQECFIIIDISGNITCACG